MAKNTGKVREFCQSGKVGTLYVVTAHQQSFGKVGFSDLFKLVHL